MVRVGFNYSNTVDIMQYPIVILINILKVLKTVAKAYLPLSNFLYNVYNDFITGGLLFILSFFLKSMSAYIKSHHFLLLKTGGK